MSQPIRDVMEKYLNKMLQVVKMDAPEIRDAKLESIVDDFEADLQDEFQRLLEVATQARLNKPINDANDRAKKAEEELKRMTKWFEEEKARLERRNRNQHDAIVEKDGKIKTQQHMMRKMQRNMEELKILADLKQSDVNPPLASLFGQFASQSPKLIQMMRYSEGEPEEVKPDKIVKDPYVQQLEDERDWLRGIVESMSNGR